MEFDSIFNIQEMKGWGFISMIFFWLTVREIKDFFNKKKQVTRNGNGHHAQYVKEFDDIDGHVKTLYSKTDTNNQGIARLEGKMEILIADRKKEK